MANNTWKSFIKIYLIMKDSMMNENIKVKNVKKKKKKDSIWIKTII